MHFSNSIKVQKMHFLFDKKVQKCYAYVGDGNDVKGIEGVKGDNSK